ncbi:MAG: hypothetical protein SVR08_11930 [Spirochaetota bacterium]|nr:hypothetical protein [Spirochaetota bacterium]
MPDENVFEFSGDFYEIEDPQTKSKIKIPNELKSIIGSIQSLARKDEKEKTESHYRPLLEEADKIKANNEAIAEELEKIKESSMNTDEIREKEFQKAIDKIEKEKEMLMKDSDHWKTQFYQLKITNDIYSSFGDSLLNNRYQTAECFQREGQAQLVEIMEEGKNTGRFETRMKISIKNNADQYEELEGTPQELFEKWVHQDQNLHHLASSLKPGGGTMVNGKVFVMNKDFENLPPAERMKIARKKGQSG